MMVGVCRCRSFSVHSFVLFVFLGDVWDKDFDLLAHDSDVGRIETC